MKTKLHNKSFLRENRRALRTNLTPAEATLWLILKNKQLARRRFRRQFSIGAYILDFYYPSEKLAIELDGKDHFTETGRLKDIKRDEFLNGLGIKTLRVENKFVFSNQSQVVDYITSNFKTK